MKNGLSRFAMLSAGVVAACSSAGTNAESSAASASADSVVVAASADTQKAIGVSSWGIQNDGTSTLVHGYDAHRASLLMFQYIAARTSTATTFIAAVQVGTLRPTKLQIEAPDGAPARVVESSIEGDSASKTILDRMVADLRSGSAPSTTTGQTTTTKTSMRLLDLVVTPQQLIDCTQLLGDAAANAGKTTTDCSADPNAPKVSRRRQESRTRRSSARTRAAPISLRRAATGSRRARRP